MFVIPEQKMILYEENIDIVKFITDFFNIRKGVRCRTRFNGRKMPFNYEDYGNNLQYSRFNLVTINKENIIPELRYGLSHFLQHIYNKEVLTEAEVEVDTLLKRNGIARNDIPKRRPIVKKVMESHYIGITNVIDIDSPYVNKNTTERMDFFEPKVIGYFNEATRLLANEFDEVGELYNPEFSGNGLYFINESYYPDEYLGRNHSTLAAYKMKIKRICDEVDYKLWEKNIPITIKFKREGWSRFNKIPFAFHDNRAKLGIPLGKEHIGNIDVKWLDEHTNVKNFIGYDSTMGKYIIDNDLIKEVIKACKWEKLW
jgi:hypothetical protein